ncbi:copper resistance protein [Salmonella enterica]|uniref:copper resistance protein n=1 Tax=Salmonella TaxID=590 RepID=UPI0009AA9855|nr:MULTISPECIES: copper resistance protein [Salmonella]EAA5483746.1 copper resistance protein [Salmonella enterica subsp. enterica]EBH8834481.1 copper resistance protein [Salmonella enterica subsp. enterica serovar Paratyphi B str. CFSAN000539]EKR1426065.1 copper resistance protein [Salmonella enterica subsp. enterica serovar 4,[5],12:b:-]QUZ65685.1 copper resistance protein [Salmonella enterica subsp. enterica serovar Paratyphi B str. CFSAN000548]HCM2015719.1 copper resistance protein [Salmon
MAKQQRMGWWFLCLACVVVMVCTAQRMAGLHALQMQATASAAVVSAPSSTDDGSPVTPCELSAKSLLAAPPVLFEGAILALCLLLSLLAPVRVMHLPFSPPRAISPPTLRVHLRFCVFRE